MLMSYFRWPSFIIGMALIIVGAAKNITDAKVLGIMFLIADIYIAISQIRIELEGIE